MTLNVRFLSYIYIYQLSTDDLFLEILGVGNRMNRYFTSVRSSSKIPSNIQHKITNYRYPSHHESHNTNHPLPPFMRKQYFAHTLQNHIVNESHDDIWS